MSGLFNKGGGGGNTSTVTSTQQPPAQYLAAFQDATNRAQGAANAPLQQYPGPFLAGFSPQQLQSFGTVQNAQGLSAPFTNAAAQELGSATAPLWPSLPQYDTSGLPQASVNATNTAQQYAQGAAQPIAQSVYPYTETAMGAAQNLTSNTTPYTNIATSPLAIPGYSSLGTYLSPYTQNVTDAATRLFNQQNAEQFNQIRGNAAAQGAWGGDREAIAESETARQQALAEDPAIAQILQQGFQQAQGELNTQQQTALQQGTSQGQLALGAGQLVNQAGLGQGQLALGAGQLTSGALGTQGQLGLGAGQLNLAAGQQYNNQFTQQQQAQLAAEQGNAWLASQAGFGLGQLGASAESQALAGAGAQNQMGAQQQQLAQQQLNIPFEQFTQQQAYPFQTAGWLANIEEGLGSAAGGTSSTAYPGPSALSQVAGAGLAGAGLLGATNAFGSNGWLTGSGGLFDSTPANWASTADFSSGARGGRIPHASGGRIGLAAGGIPGLDMPSPISPIQIPTGVPDFSLSIVPSAGAATGTPSPIVSSFKNAGTTTQTGDGGGSSAASDAGLAAGAANVALKFLPLLLARHGGRIGLADGGPPSGPIYPEPGTENSLLRNRAIIMNEDPDAYRRAGDIEGKGGGLRDYGRALARIHPALGFANGGVPTGLAAVPDFSLGYVPQIQPRQGGGLGPPRPPQMSQLSQMSQDPIKEAMSELQAIGSVQKLISGGSQGMAFGGVPGLGLHEGIHVPGIHIGSGMHSGLHSGMGTHFATPGLGHYDAGGSIDPVTAAEMRLMFLDRQGASGGRFDTGGTVDPLTAAAPLEMTSPNTQSFYQQLQQMPMEKLQEMAVRVPPTTSQGALIQRALQAKRMTPVVDMPQQPQQQQPGLGQAALPTFGTMARGGRLGFADGGTALYGSFGPGFTNYGAVSNPALLDPTSAAWAANWGVPPQNPAGQPAASVTPAGASSSATASVPSTPQASPAALIPSGSPSAQQAAASKQQLPLGLAQPPLAPPAAANPGFNIPRQPPQNPYANVQAPTAPNVGQATIPSPRVYPNINIPQIPQNVTNGAPYNPSLYNAYGGFPSAGPQDFSPEGLGISGTNGNGLPIPLTTLPIPAGNVVRRGGRIGLAEGGDPDSPKLATGLAAPSGDVPDLPRDQGLSAPAAMSPPNTPPASPANSTMALVSQDESGHRNIPNYRYDQGHTAGGFYQITDTDWRTTAPKLDIDLAKYPNAMSAPEAIQGQVAGKMRAERG